MGILFSIDDISKHEVIKSLIKDLEHDGKRVTTLAYLPKKKENHEFLFDFFTDKDVTFWGQIKTDKVAEFVNQSFDYLFYIDLHSNMYMRNIMAMSKAKCRVAPYHEELRDFSELMVEVKQAGDLKKVVHEMYRYTKQLS